VQENAKYTKDLRAINNATDRQKHTHGAIMTDTFNVQYMMSLSTEGTENDASAKHLNLTSASCDLALSPPKTQSWPFHAHAAWYGIA